MKEKIVQILLDNTEGRLMKGDTLGELKIEQWLHTDEFEKVADKIIEVFHSHEERTNVSS